MRSRAWFVAGSIAGVWTLYLLLVALRLLVITFPHKAALIERHSLVAVIGAALTIGLDFILKRLPSQTVRVKLAVGLILAGPPAVILAATNYNVMLAFDPAELWSMNYCASACRKSSPRR